MHESIVQCQMAVILQENFSVRSRVSIRSIRRVV
jgi:hypothetical protein